VDKGGSDKKKLQCTLQVKTNIVRTKILKIEPLDSYSQNVRIALTPYPSCICELTILFEYILRFFLQQKAWTSAAE